MGVLKVDAQLEPLICENSHVVVFVRGFATYIGGNFLEHGNGLRYVGVASFFGFGV